MGFFAIYCLGGGLFFLTLGWWPMFMFLGIDLIALWWAFRVCYNRSKSCELIELTRESLTVERVNHKGVTQRWEFQPSWVRLAYEKGMEDDQLDHLALQHKSESVEIARHLSHGERYEFFHALKNALSDVSLLSPIELPARRLGEQRSSA